jgi:flagellar hook-associated protein 1 FlgK
VISNSPGHEGEAIDLGTPPGTHSVLGLPLAAGQWQHHAGQLLLTGDGGIDLALGSVGTAADLAKLGLRTQASISGAAPEDLLVFASASAAGASATLSTSYGKGSIDSVAAQRARPLRLTFSSGNAYRITDERSGTVLAERTFTAGQAIAYRGLGLMLRGEPADGDSFLIDGNTDGTGDNGNANRLCALQADTSLFASGRTLAQSYADTVTGAGQVSSQASATQQALKVMEQQARQTRDSLAGVNLDNEATDLVRFQQAYQAAAKSVQIGTQLFEAVLNIR